MAEVNIDDSSDAISHIGITNYTIPREDSVDGALLRTKMYIHVIYM